MTSQLSSSSTPLLSTNIDGEPTCYQRRRRQIIIGFPCLFLFTILFFVVGYMVENGAFDHISRDVRIVNGTVTEPNTKHVYAVNRQTLIDGTPRVQRLIGLFLKVKHVAEFQANFHVFTLGVYVDRADARRELIKYKSGVPHAHQDTKSFEKFIDTISNGKISVTTEYRLVMTTAGNFMHDRWLKDLVTLWQSYGASEERIKELENCFSTWFLKHGFHDHDIAMIEWNIKNKFTTAVMNSHILSPICKDPFLGKSIISHELLENGDIVGDLLPTLWNTEYDLD